MNNLQIRNFVIISHIDHGKSTLADRLLELTNTVPKDKMRAQYLDMMDLERERGVTIKMAPVRMIWKDSILNLIDTPGHVDFAYEVSRALAAVEGALLLVDATAGIQAQTLFNLEKAQKQNLKIIPIINKIDSPAAQIEKTQEELVSLGFQKEEILQISAKTGQNVQNVLKAIIERIPPPIENLQNPLKALIFDLLYDQYKGVIAYVRVFDGTIAKNEKIKFLIGETEGEILELGYFKPQFATASKISAGEIGYLKTGIKEISKIMVGDTITLASIAHPEQDLKIAGYQQPKPMVFASIYPIEGENHKKLADALGKLKLNDYSLSFNFERSKALGAGFRCGFLGLFHLEITKERLERESALELIVTSPTVDIQVTEHGYREPYVDLEIITPQQYLGQAMELAQSHRGQYKEIKYLGDRVIVLYENPLSEIIIGFYDQLKNLSEGYASMNYQFSGYRDADLVQLDILIAGEKVEPMTQIVARSKSESTSRNIVKKLKDLVPRQLYKVSLQAAIGAKIVAREDIPAMRKDVTAPLYGGDVTRKRKLLEKQKKGKKRLKHLGKVDIPSDLFLELLKID
ncbi:MAG: elongation factor 4 [Candidatus Nealsonbacteria bacterium CG23_combo_of_CG06-09_8_20_14_all_40_13]|uniref:Elongation factor 4 n=1 Tax=Candidatus Nealsonbacteria bacterium CG23_combo_of_CG06-09_8_20_14_all_40_13 TaxID=1974724 RepID=A0A2G9YQK4_9BACT|nr:MAG: elongation factor 4 [Candidatus Nealsonbacteria bacterium CG23_combo_of_CG06-09_8_20_14_all_40_13]PIR71083.1 MAG: elongation factor 4 [Candidatus Nealsonbacteria bacterium CG10_big_fil_rev_8_21_14_0_10_40_24]